MILSTEMLAPFIGGQLEIQSQNEEHLFRGEVETIAVEDNTLCVRFKWCAKAEGYPPIPQRWVKEENLEYTASLEIYTASSIGPSSVGGGERICVQSAIVGEVCVLFPPDGSKLDCSRVEGLQVSETTEQARACLSGEGTIDAFFSGKT